MNRVRRNLPVYRAPHPAVYALMAGAVALTLLALWLLFDDGAGTALSLAVVTFFAIAFAGTPYVLYRASPHRNEAAAPSRPTFREWLEGEFACDRGVIGAKHAVAMMLLLPAAGAAGLTAISFIAHLAAIGAL